MVKGKYSSVCVNLTKKTCSCRVWDSTGVPCCSCRVWDSTHNENSTNEVNTDNCEKIELHMSPLHGHCDSCEAKTKRKNKVSFSSPVVPCVHDGVKERIHDK